MPATAGRVRMPANNRVHSSAALQTHGIWQSAIRYDPYAPNKEDNKKSAQSSTAEPEGENAYASFQGLLALARITGSNADETRGSCKKCGRVGHLTFQCRNFLSIKEDKDKDPEAIQPAVISGLEKIKGHRKRSANESSDESDGEESESSDSDYDSEIERAIAKKYGKGLTSKLKSKRDDDSDEVDSDSKDMRKRGCSKKRSVKRSTSDTDDDRSGRKRRSKKRRRKDKSSDEDRERRSRRRKSRKEKRRRRSHLHSDDSDSDSSEDSIRNLMTPVHASECKRLKALLLGDKLSQWVDFELRHISAPMGFMHRRFFRHAKPKLQVLINQM
ncbi:Zinc finger, CCHC-type [Artemisia annua]|uniref:Zinc finger, CCHC-type n=1 Tax=Artemisia annua TaxID=35608 RepID=A0A2U1KG86_ARTAN|nr:Zinc finger, CCHC-type [Artemisia annua]